MKPVGCLILIVLMLYSCKKGKTMPHDVPVQFVTWNASGIFPQGNFAPFDPTDPNEPSHTPNYANLYTQEELATEFNEDLTTFLGKNRVFLQPDSTGYRLVINTMNLRETLHRKSYTDSCSWNYEKDYVYYSSLKFSVNATLYQNGIKVLTFNEIGESRDRVRSKRDQCNAPKICSALRGPKSLVTQVARKLRVAISRELYEREH